MDKKFFFCQIHTAHLSCQMKLQQAKESFMERLARERRERESEGWVFHFSAEQSLNTPSQVDQELAPKSNQEVAIPM